ncbi:MAG: replicative DNA helicase [Patescibacteria group bacterium]|nr:replicative DNA helicase [Patescibacteria group bacterium]
MAERLPPQNTDAEESVLGALLIDKDSIIRVAALLSPAHFYRDANGEIYAAILSLYERREPADLVTVPNELSKKKKLESVGGLTYLSSLVAKVPSSANVEYYANIVRDAFVKRQLIAASAKISESAFDSNTQSRDLLDKAERSLFSISQEYLHQYFVSVKEVLETSFDRLEALHKSGSSIRGVPTGLKSLDEKLSGLQESNLIILAARPSVGKTSLALNIAQHAAVEKKIPVAVFSLETSREQLVDRLLSAQADVDGWRITTGRLEEEDFRKIGEAMGELSEAPIFIDDTPGINVLEIRTKARRLQMEQGIKLVVVDYLQLAHGQNTENRVQEVSEVSQSLKNLARELHVPVLALSQLNRSIESRGERRPQLSDLRESGSLEQDADVVIFLYREDDENRSEVRLSISKHRNGPTGEIDLYFRGERTKFFETEKLKVE